MLDVAHDMYPQYVNMPGTFNHMSWVHVDIVGTFNMSWVHIVGACEYIVDDYLIISWVHVFHDMYPRH